METNDVINEFPVLSIASSFFPHDIPIAVYINYEKAGTGNLIFLNTSKFHSLRKILRFVTNCSALLVFCLNCLAAHFLGKTIANEIFSIVHSYVGPFSPWPYASSNCGSGSWNLGVHNSIQSQ
jgi:hypothetical protein